jgi:cobalamin biosynthesis protein CobD/CbiB
VRYVLAMALGTLSAILAAVFVSGSAASWLSRSFAYTSPDQQNAVEQGVFIAVMVVAMAIGWGVGWALGRPFTKRERVD